MLPDPAGDGWRAVARRVAEQGLASSPVMRWCRSRLAGRSVVLAYHNVVPDGSPAVGDRSLHLPRADFAAQLEVMDETHEVVSLADLIAALGGGTEDEQSVRPRAAISFDDAYAGAMTVGVEELKRRGLPATVFVPPGLLGADGFWWDAFSRGDSGLPDEFRRRALLEKAGDAARIQRGAETAHERRRNLPDAFRPATERILRAAYEEADLDVAAHTWDHPNLTRLSAGEAERQIRRCLAWLGARYDDVRPWISYPYGLSSPAVEQAAARAGCTAGFGISGGWIPSRSDDRLGLPRLNVPAGMSLDGFRLRLANLLCH